MSEQEAELLKVRTKWNGKANVCIHCGSVPERFYIVTGHDHTDDSIDWCPCRDTSPTVESIQRQLAQANAVIAEQKNHIKGHLEIQQIHLEHIDEQSALIAQQVELIEKLADVLKCVDGGHTEPCWLGEMGKIEMWRVDEAISDYNQWKEQK